VFNTIASWVGAIHRNSLAHKYCLLDLNLPYFRSQKSLPDGQVSPTDEVFTSTWTMDMSTERPIVFEDGDSERGVYQRLSEPDIHVRAGPREQLRTTPLMTLAVKDTVERSAESGLEKVFDQYAVLGFHVGQHLMVRRNEPILMNVDAPNSLFICGSQGSGKSYTLNCILENCLAADRRIGRVRSPVAGVAFHYDLSSAGSVAETAYLCSIGIRVRVLVSQSNEHALRNAYSKLPEARKF